MSAFTFSAAVGIIVFSICIVIRAVRLAFMIVKILFALLFKIFRIFRKHGYNAGRGNRHSCSHRFRDASPEEIGKQGENDLCRKLRKIEKDGRILRNLYIPTSNGNTTEIDVVMLTKHGIYVFEYKNYHCNMLIPDNAEDNWLRCSDNGYSAYEVYSPVKQNINHVKALSRLLGSITGTRGIENCIESYVVLGDGCRIRTERKSLGKNCQIMNLSELKGLTKNADVLIPSFTVLLLADMLGKYNCISDIEKTNHIFSIKNNGPY